MLNKTKDSWTKDKGLVLTWPRDEIDKKTNGQLTKDKGLVLTWPQDTELNRQKTNGLKINNIRIDLSFVSCPLSLVLCLLSIVAFSLTLSLAHPIFSPKS